MRFILLNLHQIRYVTGDVRSLSVYIHGGNIQQDYLLATNTTYGNIHHAYVLIYHSSFPPSSMYTLIPAGINSRSAAATPQEAQRRWRSVCVRFTVAVRRGYLSQRYDSVNMYINFFKIPGICGTTVINYPPPQHPRHADPILNPQSETPCPLSPLLTLRPAEPRMLQIP